MIDRVFWLQDIRTTDHLGELAETEFGHEFAHFLGDELHEVDRVIGIAGEFFAQLRILGGDADRACVEMANAHHDAAE